jgi:hypothetical protein
MAKTGGDAGLDARLDLLLRGGNVAFDFGIYADFGHAWVYATSYIPPFQAPPLERFC